MTKRPNLKAFNIFAVCVIVISAILVPYLPGYAANGNWGLSFSTPGEVPRGNESVEYLKQFDAYFVGESDKKVVYLTFDAGYENGYTESILDTLKENAVPAAFFLVGTYIRDYPELINRMAKEGHIVGNHTMSHPDMSKIDDLSSFKKELSLVEDCYKSVTGLDMKKFYRPPSGKYSESNMKMAKELGYKTVFWSLAYADWDINKQPSKEAAFSKLLPRLHPGAVLLLHSTSKTNCLILDELIKTYKQMGYEFRSLEELDTL